MIQIGLTRSYYSKITSDVEGAIVYQTPIRLAEVQKIDLNPKVNRVQVPGDNRTYKDITQCLGADVSVQRAYFTLAEEADLLGKTLDANGGAYSGESDEAPDVGFGYMRTYDDGRVNCVWLLKTTFAPTNSSSETKDTGGIKPQYNTLSGSAITRAADGQWIYQREFASESAADDANFFSVATLQALSTGITPAALTVSSVPADDATGVLKTANVVLTFSNKILSEAITVIKDDGSPVTIDKSWDADRKVLTISHAAAFAGTSNYIVNINGVKDIYGQDLAATTIYFTTAA